MMTLKERLDAIWNDSKVRCPNHIVWWRQSNFNKSDWGYSEGWNILWSKGKRVQLRIKNKAKGYSFLPKNYALWRCRGN